MIRNLSDSAMMFLLYIYNKTWLKRSYPKIWSKAILLPFLKPNKTPQFFDSYRPIALTSCLCNLSEKVVNFRLVYFLETSKVYSEYQYGFRKMRSSLDALVRIETDILNAFTDKNTWPQCFFDIEKAYDTTWRYHILETIYNVGIRGRLAYFIQNFLHKRTFKVQIANTKSPEYIQEQGVPQGSVLSVTLFAIAINNIIADIPDDMESHYM